MEKEKNLKGALNSIMKNKKMILILSLIAVFIAVIVFNAVYFAKNKSTLAEVDARKNAENQIALSYGTADASTNSEYVQFSAFFTRDVNGKAEKLAGTCKNIAERDTLFLDINVLSDGYLENGAVITVEDANFTYKVNAPADEVLKNNVISDNASSFTLNKMNAGTQKLIQGEISADLGNNVDNYTKEVTVKLVGTHVSNDGVRTPINVEKKVTVDWYGDLETEIFVYKNYSKEENVDDDSIYYYFNDFKKSIDSETNTETPAKNSIVTVSFSMDEIKKELLLKENSIDIIIPSLNGKAPEKVKCINNDVLIEKVEDTENGQKYRLTKTAIIGNDDVITKKLADENTYTISIKYPEEAYEAINDETTLNIDVQGYYIAYNNPNEELNLYKDPQIAQNESKSNVANKTIKVVFKKYEEVEHGTIDFGVTILDKKYSEMKNSFVISKETLAKWFDEEEATDKFEYKVEWDAIVKGENQNSVIKMSEGQAEVIVGEENQETQYGDTFNKDYLEKYIINNGLYFENVEDVLGSQGGISIYNNDTNELIKTLTVEEAKTYTKENPLMFEDEVKQDLKHIRIETTIVINTDTKVFKVVSLKEINKDAFKADYTKADVEDIEILNTQLEGVLQSVSTADESGAVLTIKAYDCAHLFNKTSYAEIEVETKEISTVKMLEHEKIFIKTIVNNNDFDSYWKNGSFAVEIPQEIAGIAINSITADNGVTVEDWNLSEVDGRNILKIKTVNDEPTLFTITVDCDITPDYKINSTTKQFKLYYYNELANRYYSLNEDKYDVNENTLTDENVGYAEADAEFVSAQELVTFETVSNYKKEKQTIENEDGTSSTQSVWSNDTTIAPYIADVNNEERQATINIVLDNKYKSTIENVKILGKIPFEGNSYILNEENLNSQFTAYMKLNEVQGKKELIRVPAELKDKIIIYYSNKENVTNDINNEENNWKLINQLEDADISSIKSFLIDFQNEKVEFEKELVFSYDVKIPGEVQNGKYGYSNHTVYYQVSTADGKIDMTTEPTKVGIRPMFQYGLELKTYEKDTNTQIKEISYRLVWSEVDRNGNTVEKSKNLIADENGNIKLDDVILDCNYKLQQTKVDKDYIINETLYAFSIKNNGVVVLNDDKIYVNFANKVLQLKVENVKKKTFNLKIKKVDTKGNELEGAVFKITATKANEVVESSANYEMNDLYVESNTNGVLEEYSLVELTPPTGYAVNHSTLKFRVFENENGEYQFEIIDGGDFIKSIENSTEKEIFIENDTITITVVNKKMTEFTINKVDSKNETPLSGATFNIKGVNNNYSTRCSTDTKGQIKLLLEPGEYTAEEVNAPRYYYNSHNKTNFEVKEDGENEITITNDRAYTLNVEIVDEDTVRTIESSAKGLIKVHNKETGEIKNVDVYGGRGWILLKAGKYEIYQSGTIATGYEINNMRYEFEVIDQDVNIMISNKKSYTIKKVDESGKPLSGVRFTIFQINDNRSYTSSGFPFYTDFSGEATISRPAGSYIAVETYNPKSEYVLDKDITKRSYYFDIEDNKFITEGFAFPNVEMYDDVTYIRTVDDWNEVARKVNSGVDSYENKRIILLEDLDFNGKTFTPIGRDYTNYFKGNFDGGAHTINNVKNKNVFGYIRDSNIYNINFYNVDWQAGNCVGIIGYAYNSAIWNITVRGTDFIGSINSDSQFPAGTIVGYSSGGTIINCVNERNYKINTTDIYGGIAGRIVNTKVFNCENKGNISAYYSGGICYESNGSRIENCYNSCSVLNGSDVGGIVFRADEGETQIKNCKNSAEISYGGGIVRIGNYVNITNSYNYGKLKTSYASRNSKRTI